MLGRALAPLEPGLRQWVLRAWGYPDIHSRQHWRAVWPVLSGLPTGPLQVIDAGCGRGRWTLELAHRRRGWTLLGVDRDAAAVDAAQRSWQQLGAPANASFVCADVREFAPERPADVVLSITSAHYLAEGGEGPALFARYASWLAPGGLLVLLGPRVAASPFVPWLAHPAWHSVFSGEQLGTLCRDASLEVQQLHGSIGRLGVVAKQLAWTAGRRGRAVAALAYPAEWSMAAVDHLMPSRDTLMWVLVARRHDAATPRS